MFTQAMFAWLEKYLSDKIVSYISQPTGRYAPFYAPDPELVRRALKPGDILLVEGNSRLSATIKYLTQSTWSHAALYLGERPGDVAANGEPNVFLEAEADTGVVTCFDANTGEIKYSERLSTAGQGFTASPVSDGRHLYFTSELGNVFVLPVADKFSAMASIPLHETCMSTPAISDGTLFFRTREKLIAVSANR